MHRRLSVVIVALFALLILSPVDAAPLSVTQCFAGVPGIRSCIDGRFNEFWNDNGGLPVFGYPLINANPEVNPDDHTSHDTQWFERNRFEHHSEHAAPYDVLLGRLGAELLQAQGRDWHTEPPASGYPNGNPLGGTCQHFNDTNRDVCGLFLTYWKGHGLSAPKLDGYGKSLALFGLPLTGVKLETNPNGDTVLTQWFERARFEFHPEVGNIVLLGLLGNERRAGGGAYAPVATPTQAAPGPTPTSVLPTPTSTAIPTPVPPLPTTPPVPSGTRIGAVCRDGTISSATGSGACSHHGGVDHWIIAP